MGKKCWTIEARRSDLLRYLSWELGLHQALKYAAYFKAQNISGFVRLAEIPCPRDLKTGKFNASLLESMIDWTKKGEVMNWARHMFGVACFVEGRLRRQHLYTTPFNVVKKEV